MKIELHLTLPEFEALRAFLRTDDETTSMLAQVREKVEAIDERVQKARKLSQRLGRHD